MSWLIALLALAAQDAAPLPGTERAGPDIDLIEEPRTRERPEARLDRRLDDLREAPSEDAAALIAGEIRSMWRQQAGPTADLLLSRGTDARAMGDLDTAARQYTHLRRLEPDFAEGWLATAEIAAAQGDWPFALEAVERAIALEPRRFDAYALLGRALEEAEAWQAAMAAYDQALAFYPLMPQARAGKARVERQLTGRAL